MIISPQVISQPAPLEAEKTIALSHWERGEILAALEKRAEVYAAAAPYDPEYGHLADQTRVLIIKIREAV